jgi:four helix bundle protein
LAAIKSHRDLVVWNKSIDLVVQVYALTDRLPRREQFRLVDQICRAVASVPANIAEGHARATRNDYAHFVSIAHGSLAETETFILLAIRLKYLAETESREALDLIDEIGRMLSALRAKLRPYARPANPNP